MVKKKKKTIRKKTKLSAKEYRKLEKALDNYMEFRQKQESAINEIEHNKNLLTEGQLNEVSFKKAVDKVISFVRKKIQGLWQWFTTRIATIANKIIPIPQSRSSSSEKRVSSIKSNYSSGSIEFNRSIESRYSLIIR